MYMLNMVIILIVMYCNVVTAIDKIPTYLLRFNKANAFDLGEGRDVEGCIVLEGSMLPCVAQVATGVCEVGGIRRLSFVV